MKRRRRLSSAGSSNNSKSEVVTIATSLRVTMTTCYHGILSACLSLSMYCIYRAQHSLQRLIHTNVLYILYLSHYVDHYHVCVFDIPLKLIFLGVNSITEVFILNFVPIFNYLYNANINLHEYTVVKCTKVAIKVIIRS